jgi:MoxR-like ATPase
MTKSRSRIKEQGFFNKGFNIPESVTLDTAADPKGRQQQQSDQQEVRVHCFDDPEDDARKALAAAWGANRPLLVRGEPGVGKTQLAEAAARAMNRLLLTVAVDSRTESRDLLYSFDAVRRLAEAQLQAALPAADDVRLAERRAQLDADRFVVPGRLWWAFHWESARSQAIRADAPEEYSLDEWTKSQGAVLLIDEIDKAEADVPNGLLEALGSREFQPPCGIQKVSQTGAAPLILITTNEERALPEPFLRRCVVLNLRLPGDDNDPKNEALRTFLERRGKAHFPRADERILRLAATDLLKDRHAAYQQGIRPLPGQAEYLDLVRAVLATAPNEVEQQEKSLKAFSKFILRKQVIP